MNNTDKGMKVVTVLIIITTVILLAPMIYVSKYAYPWADDFSYGAGAHLVYVSTGSAIKAIVESFKSTISTYFEWQGTYTSCFLMSLQPAVWSVKIYHLTGTIMLITMLGAYIAFGLVVFKRLWKMSFAEAVSIALLAYLASAEFAPGIAEAFTWYNSAVHYTFMNALLVLFVAMVALYLFGISGERNGNKRIISTVAICIFGFVVAGGNNITTLAGVLVLLILAISIFVMQDRKRKLSDILRFLPVFISYLVGFLLNVFSPGNKMRGAGSGLELENADYGAAIINSFRVSFTNISDKFSWELLAVLIAVAVIAWHSFSKKNAEKIGFRFPLPILVVFASYCLLVAMYCPVLTGTSRDSNLLDIYLAATQMARTENIIYFSMVLLMVFDIVYCLGWIYQKGLRWHSGIAEIALAVIAVVICVVGARSEMASDPGQHDITSTAIGNLQNGTAAYYGLQMAENTNRLLSEDDPVYVTPIAVNPNSLYPYDAADWKEGAILFYYKESVEYESEPYTFTR